MKYQEVDLGMRVVFPEGYDCYPHFKFTERLEGEVVSLHDDFVIVKLDTHKEELDEWDNCIHAYSDANPAKLDEVPGLEKL